MAKRLWTGLLIILALSGVAFLNSQAASSSSSNEGQSASTSEDIEQLTKQDRVISYLREHQRLPSFTSRKNRPERKGGSLARGIYVVCSLAKRLAAIVFRIVKNAYPKKLSGCGEKLILITVVGVGRPIG